MSEERLKPGETIDRFVVRRFVGEGGMGQVYEAHDPKLDRRIAIKLIRFGSSSEDDENRARLLQEAQVIAKLSHPNVVVVHDVGMFGDRAFIAMEYIDGTTLRFWREAEPRSWREVVSCLAAAGRGLAAAHRAGLVHRDFKPDNMMVDADGQVRVMDFGLARLADDGEAAGSTTGAPAGGGASAGTGTGTGEDQDRDATRNFAAPAPAPAPRRRSGNMGAAITQQGTLIGTPAYMSPEQLAGSTATPLSDQFCFCITLYEMLYGRRPYPGKNLTELIDNVIAGAIRAPPPKTDVPRWVHRIVLRGLHSDPARRYPSMNALLAALNRDPTRVRNRWMAVGAAAVGLAGLAVTAQQAISNDRRRCLGAERKLVGIWETAPGVPSPRQQAVQIAFERTGRRYAADSYAAVAGGFKRLLGRWSSVYRDACEATHVRGEQSAEVLDLRMSCLDDRLAEVKALIDVLTDADGEVVSRAAQAVESIRSIEQCGDLTTLRAVVRPPADGETRRRVDDLRSGIASLKALTSAGRYRQALQRSVEIVDRARALGYDPALAEALAQVGDIEYRGGDPAKAEAAYEEAFMLAEGTRHDEVAAHAGAELVFVVGHLQRRFAEGERWALLAGSVLRRMGAGHEIIAAWRANNLAAVYLNQGKVDKALATALQAVALKRKVLGESHFDVALSLGNVAIIHAEMGRFDEAIAENAGVLAILRDTLGPDHPSLAQHLASGGEFLAASERWAEAQELADQALGVWQRELPPDHPYLAAPLTTIGWSWIRRNHRARAIPLLERALAIRAEKDPEPGGLGDVRFALASALVDGDADTRDRAMTLARQARSDYADARKPQRVAAIDAWLRANMPAAIVSRRHRNHNVAAGDLARSGFR